MAKLYTNPRGLYPFQAQIVARCYLSRGKVVVADAGLGKSHIALATAALLLEDGKIDLVVLLCEKDKIDEWMADIAMYTALRATKFHGPKRVFDPFAQVIVTTYATWSKELVDTNPADSRDLIPTELFHTLASRRVLAVYDEMATLGTSRVTKAFKSNRLWLASLRDRGEARVLGLTATPMTTTPECYFNLGLITDPEGIGTYKRFCEDHVVAFNRWDRPWKFRDLDGLERKLSRWMIRKRKTDADVCDQFPKTVEKAVYLDLHPAHLAAYRAFEAWINAIEDESELLPAFKEMSAFAAHPQTVLVSGWVHAQEWALDYGHDKIRKIPSIKCEAVIGYVSSIVHGDSGGVLVFNDSVRSLRCLAREIDRLPEPFDYVEFHGGMSDAENRKAKERFKAGEVKVMLASAKAERGINMPEASYIVNYGLPTLHSAYVQRAGRGSRIGTNTDGIVVIKSFITRSTIERGIVRLWQKRNEWTDQLQDPFAYTDDNFVSAWERHVMFQIAQRMGEVEEKAS